MTTPRLSHIALAFAALLALLWAVAAGSDSCNQNQGTQAEQVSHQQVQEAQTHVQAAESIPGHQAELARLSAEVARLRAQANRSKVGVKPVVSSPVQPIPSDAVVDPGLEGDGRDLVGRLQSHITDLEALTEAQAGQIAALDLALRDEQRRSGEWEQAFRHERNARQAQEAATKAWKQASKEARTQGRIEGGSTVAALWGGLKLLGAL